MCARVTIAPTRFSSAIAALLLYTLVHLRVPILTSHLDDMVIAGPSRGPDPWQPTRYLEPNQPDNEEVLEQAAYQAAVTKLGGDARARRYKPRRTVDYMGPMTKWRLDAKLKAVDYMAAIHPNPSDLIGVSHPKSD